MNLPGPFSDSPIKNSIAPLRSLPNPTSNPLAWDYISQTPPGCVQPLPGRLWGPAQVVWKSLDFRLQGSTFQTESCAGGLRRGPLGMKLEAKLEHPLTPTMGYVSQKPPRATTLSYPSKATWYYLDLSVRPDPWRMLRRGWATGTGLR